MTVGAGLPADPGPSADAATLAAEAMDLVGSDPHLAVERAEQALRAPSARRDAASRTLAWRAVGLAARARGEPDVAESALRQAVRAATQAGDRASAAEARMTLSFVLLDLGRTPQALRQSARAAADLDGVAQLRLQAQRALVLQRCGRLAEALATYDQVVPALRAAADSVWESRALSNRGILHAYRGDVIAAEADLTRAGELLHRDGRELDAAAVLWNLGCLARERGDVVLALRRFDEADPVCDAHGFIVGLRLLDRASLMLAVGAVGEARELAERGRAALADARQEADVLECDALLARITLLDHDPASALEHARAALAAARQQGRPGWALHARLLELLAEEADPRRHLLRRARDLAEALDAAAWTEAAAEARLAGARIAAELGRRDEARALLADVGGRGGRAGRGSAVAQVRRWHTEAVVAHAGGDRRRAATAVRAGMAVLSRHRASLGAGDLQAHVPTIGEELAQVGLRLALESGSATRVLHQVERWRAQDVLARPVRPPRDPELSVAIARLRRASADLQSGGAGAGAAAAAQLQAQLAARERDVVRLSRRTRGGPWSAPARPASVAELTEGLGSNVLVELLAIDGELLAVTLGGVGSAAPRSPRLHRLGSVREADLALELLQFALARLATGRGSERALAAALDGARESAATLDRLLLRPLHDVLRPGGADPSGGGLVIAPTESLHAVPWSCLDSLRDQPVHLARSGSAWLAARSHRSMRPPKSVDQPEAFVSGPGVRAVEVLAHRGRATATATGEDATVARTLELLDGAGVAHVAAHGVFRADNPLLSSLRLADGDLTVYDLEDLRVPPQLVVLAACHSATAQVLPGNQLLGVAHALLGLGTAGVVATTLPTPDDDTALLMASLHEHLSHGSDAGTALMLARRSLDLDTPSGYATSAGFDLYGC